MGPGLRQDDDNSSFYAFTRSSALRESEDALRIIRRAAFKRPNCGNGPLIPLRAGGAGLYAPACRCRISGAFVPGIVEPKHSAALLLPIKRIR